MPSQPCPYCPSEFVSQSVLGMHIAHAHLTYPAAQPISPGDYGFLAMTASQYGDIDEQAVGPQRNGVHKPYGPTSQAGYTVGHFSGKAPKMMLMLEIGTDGQSGGTASQSICTGASRGIYGKGSYQF